MNGFVGRRFPRMQKTSAVRMVQDESLQSAGRRQALRSALPAASLALGISTRDAAATVVNASAANTEPAVIDALGAMRARIVRDFNDPWIELLRLLHEAAEVEHALMLQYLYAAFSVKPLYPKIVGHGAPSTDDLIGIAVQEMQHLGKVNQLLVALGAAPKLVREDFPYEPQIYPFRFNLEPLSRGSLAKYVWTEAPIGATDGGNAQTADDRLFCDELALALGTGSRPNYVGSLYTALIAALKELGASGEPGLPDLLPWVAVMHDIKEQGEVGHFQCFKRLFMGSHEGFAGHGDVWQRPASDALYPAYPLPSNPTAYVGHEHQIADPQLRALAWLGNLHYWVVLTLLATGYSAGSAAHVALARGHMMGPFWALARKLAAAGAGMPFDPLSIGYAPGVTRLASAHLLSRLLGEADRLEKRLGGALPGDFPPDSCRGTLAALSQLEPRIKSARAPRQPWDDGLA